MDVIFGDKWLHLSEAGKWMLNNDYVCPNCDVDFRTVGEQHNMYPHLTGACKKTS